MFFSLHRQEILERPQYARLRVGVIEGGVSKAAAAPNLRGTDRRFNHRRFQTAVRKFVEEVVFPDAQAREEDGTRASQSVFDAMAKMNLIAMRLGPGKHLKGRVLMGGIVKPEEFDPFHELIIWQEFSRIHARGYSDGLGAGTCIGLPPVLNFGGKHLKDAIVEDILSGKKFICLAVTEAFAGSDVAGIKCHARPTKDGWVVNGTKKWITNGTFADYFIVACRTDEGEIVVLMGSRDVMHWRTEDYHGGMPEANYFPQNVHYKGCPGDCERCGPNIRRRELTRSGMGKFIEHYHRTLPIDAVGGGAEDILGDLGVRQALRKMPSSVRLWAEDSTRHLVSLDRLKSEAATRYTTMAIYGQAAALFD
ncbi:acyl-CoA dehydrogenase/oxidase [Flammula alnicola]|nr:acyl-CoA dehydrogenase/oxidase [Flammula alnicola]